MRNHQTWNDLYAEAVRTREYSNLLSSINTRAQVVLRDDDAIGDLLLSIWKAVVSKPISDFEHYMNKALFHAKVRLSEEHHRAIIQSEDVDEWTLPEEQSPSIYMRPIPEDLQPKDRAIIEGLLYGSTLGEVSTQAGISQRQTRRRLQAIAA